MTNESPLIEMRGVTKDHGAAQPLRIDSFDASGAERVVVAGFDAAAAETFFHLISAAAVPDTGTVCIAGTDTRTIATDTEWLMSLDRFGFMTHRAVLLDNLGVGANLALPMTLDVEPMPATVRAQIQVLAADVGLDAALLDKRVGALDALNRARLHLGRSLAAGPRLLLLERPTQELVDDPSRAAFGRDLKRAAAHRGVGFIALSDDAVFARATGARHDRLVAATGQIVRQRRWWLW